MFAPIFAYIMYARIFYAFFRITNCYDQFAMSNLGVCVLRKVTWLW